MSEKNINLNVNLYDQSGNFGAGHVSESEIKGQAKLVGKVSEAKENSKTTPQSIESKKTTGDKQKEKPLYKIVIEGKVTEIDYLTIEKIRQKCSEFNLKIVEVREGSIEIIVEGSEEDIERFKALIQSGELTELSGRTIENVKAINSESEEEELRNKVNSRNQLVQELRSNNILVRKLKQSDLRDIFLPKTNLRKANLSFSNLDNVYLSNANLSDANLSSTDLSGANLSGANLSGANLRNAILFRANLIDADLSNANLSGAYLRKADLIDADLSSANLSNSNLSSANLSRTVINKHTKLDSKWCIVWEIINHGAQYQDLSSVDLSNAYLVGVDLRHARLVRANLIDSQLNKANLTEANLIGADLRNTNLLEADLTDADLGGAKVENARFGYNQGISQMMRRALESRGAIFEDSPPGNRSRVLTRI